MAAPKPTVPIASTTKVTPGQTISGIAAKAGVSVAAIAAANPQITNLNKISVNQVVNIPVVNTATKTASNTYAGGVTGGANPFAANSGVSTTTLEGIYKASGLTPTTGSTTTGVTTGGATTTTDTSAADAIAAAEKAKLQAELDAAKAKAEQDAQALADANARAAAAAAQLAGLTGQYQSQLSAIQAQLAAQQAQAQAAANAAAQAEAAKRESVGKIVAARFAQYGLATLGAKVLELAKQGYTEDTITLELQNSEEYKIRFAANEERLKKGLTVLTPAEYLSVEDAYRQTLRAYGLTQFDNDSYVKQFIANDVSPSELSNRVVTAVQRVQNADPAVAQTLRDYYGIGQADMVAYVLDPNQKLQEIQRKVAASEIGVAARRQGLEAGVSVAEQLAAQGVTQAEAQKGYATIADILPTAKKLSDIYGTTLEGYGQGEAEQEVFNQLASAQRKRQALTAKEISTFTGSSGMAKTASRSLTGGQI